MPVLPRKQQNLSALRSSERVDVCNVREQLTTQGVVALRGVLDPGWISALRGVVDDVCTSQRADVVRAVAPLGETAWVETDASKWHDALRERVAVGPLPELVQAATGAQQLQWHGDQVFNKPPRSAAATPLHQDRPCTAAAHEQVAVAWVPLDAVTLETGGMIYVPGSHRWSQRTPPQEGNVTVTDWLRRHVNDLVEDPAADAQRITLTAQPGDVIIHDWRMLHGSAANCSRMLPRRTLSVRYALS